MNPVRAALHAIRTGRFERSLSALTAAGAAVTTAEIYFSHDGASFGNRMMYWPVVVVPTAIPAGLAAFFSRRAAHTVLPAASALIVANGLQAPTCIGVESSRGRADSPSTTWNPVRRRSRPPAGVPGRRDGTAGRPAASRAPARRRSALMLFRPTHYRAVTPQNRGRFDGFDVLAQVDKWDTVTAGVVLARLALPSMLAFFTVDEVAVATPMLDLLLAQDADPKIPVLELIDARLAAGGRRTGGITTTCPRTVRHGVSPWPRWMVTPTIAVAPAMPTLPARIRHAYCRTSKTCPTAVTTGTAGLPDTSGAYGPGMPARRSTRILGRGTRWGGFPGRLPTRISESRCQRPGIV